MTTRQRLEQIRAFQAEREAAITAGKPPTNLIVSTMVPSKWRFVDLENGQVWRRSEDDSQWLPAYDLPGPEAAAQAAELQTLFDLRFASHLRALARWQTAAPGREMKLPDEEDLVVFLLEQLEGLSRESK